MSQDSCGRFEEWIEQVRKVAGRLECTDQTPQSLEAFTRLAQTECPTVIVEIGVGYGLSLRAWVSATKGTMTRILAVDRNFGALDRSLAVLPLNPSRVRRIEADACEIMFRNEWKVGDRVLLYVDAHGASIMQHVLGSIVPTLPLCSVIAVDDLWYSPETLADENLLGFYLTHVERYFRHSRKSPPHKYAPYWEGGSYYGFSEVVPLMAWVNARKIELTQPDGTKHVYFWRPEASA